MSNPIIISGTIETVTISRYWFDRLVKAEKTVENNRTRSRERYVKVADNRRLAHSDAEEVSFQL